ncbi:uncharacterized protein LOC143041237 [Oratosquilla oratoria]|uniref:uncharacterized protein LOC143041237 n=1 Tax=Oratosquilla oratoria TaxID=337810 RepID=UPI003F766EBC
MPSRAFMVLKEMPCHKEREDILNRWVEHFQALLSHCNITDDTVIDALPNLPPTQALDRLLEFREVVSAITSIKEGKSCGLDCIPEELLKHRGYLLKMQLHKTICDLSNGEHLPKSWIDSITISIYKNKGERKDCNKSRGLFLLSAAGKMLARLMMSRLITRLSEPVLPEAQCRFSKFLSMLKTFHTNMKAKVCIGGSNSILFPVEMGVKMSKLPCFSTFLSQQ